MDRYTVISERSLEKLCQELNELQDRDSIEIVAYTQEFGVTKLLLDNKRNK